MAAYDVVRCPSCAKLTLPRQGRCQHCKANLSAKPNSSAAPTYQPRKRRISNVKSPCIGTCMLFPGTQMCSGCFRTVDEVRDWIAMTDDERLAVIAELDGRCKIHGPPRLPPKPTGR
ncbi:MAG: DUF1289 domain-containing protein [Alphaproteobacteria bacterium]